VVDRESGELIRQIPSEEVLRMTQRMESLTGLLLQEKA
jgi:flagellar protein FlaG